jgi:hypothetical protein
MGKRRSVTCETHGPRRPAFVCRHLVQGSGLGFFTPDDPGDDLEAWCGECDQVLERCGGWDDESEKFTGVTLVCDLCFAAARRRNSR